MALNFKKSILLTGAGFTANFGGLLAREMWSKILNNPKIDTIPAIKSLLKDNFDFESVYANAGVGQGKSTLLEIIIESYSSMDNALKTYSFNDFRQFGIATGAVTKFIGSFAGKSGEIGFHFTLNQDLFLERKTHIVSTGLSGYQYHDYHQSIQSSQVTSSDHILLPDDTFLSNFKAKHFDSAGDFRYVKLHGSLGWIGNDGNRQMILGTNKLEDINKIPLLKWYFELFQEVISRPDIKLFVVGYSFRDQHVNDCIVSAIDKHNLKICIVSPEDPEHLKERLWSNPLPGQSVSYAVSDSGRKIWRAIAGYFPYRLKDIFPIHETSTHIALDLKRASGSEG